MNLNTDNEIDIQINNTFSADVIESFTPENLEYFGINLSSDPNSDFVYKIYYEKGPSEKIYENEDNNPILDYIYSLNMVKCLQVVYDNTHSNFSKFDIGLKNRTNENMLKIFSYLEKNVPLFKKYKNEIINLSEMKLFDDDNLKYSSFHFLGFDYKNGENVLLKTYWSNYISAYTELFDKNYYMEYLNKKSNIPQFRSLSLIANNTIENCGGRLYMEGIDYKIEGPVSHKIYVVNPDKNVYTGLLNSISDKYIVLKDRINIIKTWNELHPEIKCAIFAVGNDIYNNLNLKLYYSIKEDKGQPKLESITTERKLKKTITRFYAVKQTPFTRREKESR